MLGPLLEEKYGSKVLLKCILLTAVTTGIINYICFPHQGLCGASGVVFTFIILSSFTGIKDKEIPLTFLLVSIVFIGQQVYNGMTSNDNISYMAHIIGGIIGAILGYKMNRKDAY